MRHRQPRAGRVKAAPSKREAARLFQIGDEWLAREATSKYLQHCRYDPGTGKVRRKSTGIEDLEQAKLWLAERVLEKPPEEPLHPDNVTIASIKSFYVRHHIDAKVGDRDKVRDKKGPKRAFDLVNGYLEEMLEQEGVKAAPKVGHFTLARQESFMIWCRDEKELSGKTISTYLSYFKAGCNFSTRPRIVQDSFGRKREVRVLDSVPYIEDSEEAVAG